MQHANNAPRSVEQNPYGSNRRIRRFMPSTQYRILKILEDHVDPMYLVAWADAAYQRGVYRPRGACTHARSKAWSSVAGRIFSAFGLVKRSTNKVRYVQIRYALTTAGRAWLRNYEANTVMINES